MASNLLSIAMMEAAKEEADCPKESMPACEARASRDGSPLSAKAGRGTHWPAPSGADDPGAVESSKTVRERKLRSTATAKHTSGRNNRASNRYIPFG